MKRSLGLFALAALTSAISVSSCGKSGTYVVVYFQKGDLTEAVHQLDVTLQIGSQLMVTKMFTEPNNAEISFPTDASFNLQSGEGLSTLTVVAKNAVGTVVATKSQDAVIKRGKTTEFIITLGAVVITDGGVDAAPDGGDSMLVINKNVRDFGTLVTGSSSAPGVFTVTNTGTVPSGMLSLTLGGANASEFSASGCEGVVLSPGGACQVVATFRPTTAGMQTASFNVTGNPGGQVSAMLSGLAVAPGALVITPVSRNFGTAAIGGSSAIVTFEVSNSGLVQTGTLVTLLTGSDMTQFVITSDGCLNQQLSPGGKCMVSVRFKPTAEGPMASSLAVNGVPGGTAVATLAGTGLPAGSLSISPPSLDFPATLMGSDSPPAGVTVTNTGGTTLMNLDVKVSGSHSGDFVIVNDGCSGIAIQPSNTCVIDLKFHPSGGGAKVASISVTAAGGSASASLTGVGVTPAALALMPGSHDFGQVALNSSATATFNVTNGGGTASGIVARTITGTDFSIMGSTCSTTVGLAPGAGCQITVKFSPLSTPGARSGNLNVSASPGGSVNGPLSGTALTPGGLSISPSSNDFGSVNQGGESAPVQFRVTNTSGGATGMITLGISGSGSAHFQVVTGTDQCSNQVLANTASCTVSLKYAPIASGPHSATFTVAASPGGVATAPLSGMASSPAQLTITPTPFTFPDTPASGQSTSQNFTVKNNGGQPATNVTGFLSGMNPGDFQIVTNGCNNVTVQPTLTCVIAVRFRPQSAGLKNASVQVSSTSGASAAASISGNAPAGPQLAISPPSGDFGSQQVSTSSQPIQFTIRNGGGGTTSQITIAISGLHMGDFSKQNDTCQGVQLGASGTCTVDIVFTPQGIGPRMAQVQASAVQGGNASSSLTGDGFSGGTPPMLVVSPISHNYGVVQTNNSESQAFEVQNTGGQSANGLSFSIMQQLGKEAFFIDSGTFNDCTPAQNLGPGENCFILVRFTPLQATSYNGTLMVSAAAGGSPNASLMGTGSTSSGAPFLEASFYDYDFGPVQTGSMESTTWRITNTGDAPSGLPFVMLTGRDAIDFGFSNFCTSPIAMGDSCDVTIFFHPVTRGTKTARIELTASPGNTVGADLTGQANAPDGGVDSGVTLSDGGGDACLTPPCST